MKLVQPLVGAILLVGVALGAARTAHPQEVGVEGSGLRGAGAQVHGQVVRLKGEATRVAPAETIAAADELLVGLRPRVWDPQDALDLESVVAVAREVADVRSAAVLAALEPMNGSRRDFLRSVATDATVGDWRFGVPASITLAQAILESDWGRAAPGFNLFGLKGEGPAGHLSRRVVEYRGGRRRHYVMADFRVYNEPGEAVLDHGRILATSRAYGRARAAGEDRAAFARGLQGVYATDPRYASKLMKLIDSLHLGGFDVLTAGPWR